MTQENYPSQMRLHIGIFGNTNSGKSSLMNTITNQNKSIVSKQKGTTTDPVRKAIELKDIGPVIFIDTAGFADKTEIGKMRIDKTMDILYQADIAICVFSPNDFEKKCNFEWAEKIVSLNKPFIPVLNKIDKIDPLKINEYVQNIRHILNKNVVLFSSFLDNNNELFNEIKKIVPKDFFINDFTKQLCKKKDSVLLVMPQDIQAPKGRLILPQVQILRELLDKNCLISCCTEKSFSTILKIFYNPPRLIITDSQIFKEIYKEKPKESLITSFSILMAANKGDINLFLSAAKKIKDLNNNSKVLIAEACTHTPTEEDIGRVKIPNLLKKIYPKIKIDFVRGIDFPSTFTKENGELQYDFVIHCGSCMFNSQYVKTRQQIAQFNNVPMTNYGLAIAALTGILDDIAIPE